MPTTSSPRLRAGRAARIAAFACAALAPSIGPARSLAQSVTPIVLPASGGDAWSHDGIARLARDLDGVLGTSAALRGAHVGVLAVDAASGRVLYARNAGDEFQPASTLKLLVGSAALERLGAGYRFHTSLDAVPSQPGSDSVDAVILRAGGDPFLARADLDAAAAAVAQAGFTSLRATYVDDSHDTDPPYAPGWTWDDFAYDYAARVSPMTFEENVVHLSVSPGAALGAAAVVRGGDPSVTVTSLATTGAPGTPSTIDVAQGVGGTLDLIGSIPLGGEPEAVDGAVPDPPAYARAALVAALRAHGVANDDALPLGPTAAASMARTGTTGRPLWHHDSAALGTWLGTRFWIPSDNLVGELLLAELGFVSAGAPGSRDSGIAFETAWLQSLGVDPATVTLADGSGLSQYDRIAPRDLVAILQHDWNGPSRRLILDSLPVGGARGTIEGIAGSAAAGRVFAKTGSMMHVRGLAGYLAPLRHGAVTFAFNVDDWVGDYRALAALRARVLARIVTD